MEGDIVFLVLRGGLFIEVATETPGEEGVVTGEGVIEGTWDVV